jgi:hypothetical protein
MKNINYNVTFFYTLCVGIFFFYYSYSMYYIGGYLAKNYTLCNRIKNAKNIPKQR